MTKSEFAQSEEMEYFYKCSEWYRSLSSFTFPTSFVKLKPLESQALASGQIDGKIVSDAIHRLAAPMNSYPGNCFVSVDTAAPTDTTRFALKRGAVYSPESAWKYLAASKKIREAVSDGDSDHICIRPFRRVTRAREFRLFIYKGRLAAMSQYWLTRHYRRLDKVRNKYLDAAKNFVESVAWLLPAHTMVMDIYFTARREVLIIDLNPWGPPTSPLLLKSWERNWSADPGIFLIEAPEKITGNVRVSP